MGTKVMYSCETLRATERSHWSSHSNMERCNCRAITLWSPSLWGLLFLWHFSLTVIGALSLWVSVKFSRAAHSLLSSSSSGRFKPGMNLRRRLRKLFCLGFLCSELKPPCFSPEVDDDDEDPLM